MGMISKEGYVIFSYGEKRLTCKSRSSSTERKKKSSQHIRVFIKKKLVFTNAYLFRKYYRKMYMNVFVMAIVEVVMSVFVCLVCVFVVVLVRLFCLCTIEIESRDLRLMKKCVDF